MTLITRYQLASRSVAELHALYREIYDSLILSHEGSPERRCALASLENILAELHSRALRPPGP